MELRKDYILDRWVIIASNRGKRPHQFKQESNQNKPKTDFFAPGNEHLTPPEIMRLNDEKDPTKWKMRVFPNKFAAVEHQGNSNIETHNDFYTFASAFGHHEVIVETPDDRQIWDLNAAELLDLLNVYQTRIEELSKEDAIKYVQIFKNSGIQAGTSIVHSHSQIVAYNHVPTHIQQKIESSKNYGKEIYERIIESEKNSDRKCFENNSAIAFTPYASRFPFEIWLFPKTYAKDLSSLSYDTKKDMAEILQKILAKLKTLNAPFNYVLHYAPSGSELHMHFEILPRLATWAGFEMNGDIINTMPPEEAAKFYRGEDG